PRRAVGARDRPARPDAHEVAVRARAAPAARRRSDAALPGYHPRALRAGVGAEGLARRGPAGDDRVLPRAPAAPTAPADLARAQRDRIAHRPPRSTARRS